MKTLFVGLLTIVCIVSAYFTKEYIYKRSIKAVETRTYIYYFFHFTGDKAVRLARSGAIIGEAFFIFFLFFSIIAFILLL